MMAQSQFEFKTLPYSWKHISLMEFLYEGNIPIGWKDFFEQEKIQKIILEISNNLKSHKEEIFPEIHEIFRSFLPLNKIKVVLIGQDCYPSSEAKNTRECSATGLAFSVRKGNKINPSLRNIYKEIENSGYIPNKTGNLQHWKDQGVFLLNKSLSVERGNPDSHTAIWWNFTDEVIKYVVKNTKNVVWLLFGRNAQQSLELLNKNHKIYCTSHPSPLAARKQCGIYPSFLGSGVFLRTNKYLKKYKKSEIIW